MQRKDFPEINNQLEQKEIMSQDTTFSYKYSAKENKEVQEIRKKYLPQGESKIEELKRLDKYVQSSGTMEALCAGIGGFLVFGLGMCLAMQVIGSGLVAIVFGILFGIAGTCGMLAAYPVYRKIFNRTKEKYTARILELTEELISDKKERGNYNG